MAVVDEDPLMNPQQPQVVPDPTNTPDPSTTDLLDEQVKPRRNRSISKLEKLTGRRESLEQVKVYIEAENPAEAMQNAKSLWILERLKKRLGERPVNSPTFTSTPKRGEQASSVKPRDEKRRSGKHKKH